MVINKSMEEYLKEHHPTQAGGYRNSHKTISNDTLY